MHLCWEVRVAPPRGCCLVGPMSEFATWTPLSVVVLKWKHAQRQMRSQKAF